jgi:hypothetical protein
MQEKFAYSLIGDLSIAIIRDHIWIAIHQNGWE